MDNVSSLFNGEHTRCIQVSTPTVSAGGIVQFTEKRLTCMGCRALLGPSEKTVCKHCKSREAELYMKQLITVQNLEQQFSTVWTQCQRCQGSLHQEVLCASRDCPIFYRRKKIQKDLKDTQELIERWNINNW